VSGGALSGELSGGAERCCLELSRWLVESGVDVMIAAPQEPGARPFPHMALLRAARWKPLRKLVFDYVSPGNARVLRGVIAQFKPDVVHVHNIYGIASQLVRVASQHVPTIVTVHDYWPIDVFVPRIENGLLRYPLRNTFLMPWIRVHRRLHGRNLRGATLVAPSRYLADRMSQCGYRNVTVIRNGVSVPSETTAREPLLLFVGRLAPEKGLQTVLAVADNVTKRAGWRIEVVGDGPLRAQLEHRHPGVHFAGWTDPAPFYQRASVVAVPSQWPENLPYVILEAMSFGVTVLASKVGGAPELIEHGRTGVLFEAGNPEAFASALRALIANPEAQELGNAGRRYIEAECRWSVVGPKYLTLYEDMLSKSAASATPERATSDAIQGRAQ